MPLDQVANFIQVLVSGTHASGDSTVSLQSGEASKLPDLTGGKYNLVWFDSQNFRSPDTDPNVEIVRVNSIDTTNDTISVTRGVEDTSASAKNTSGATYELFLGTTAKTITDIDSQKLDQNNRYSDSEATSAVESHSFTDLDTGAIVNDSTTHLSFDGTGDVSTPNGELKVSDNIRAKNLTNIDGSSQFYFNSAGNDIRFFDNDGDSDIALFKSSGNVRIPNGQVSIPNGQLNLNAINDDAIQITADTSATGSDFSRLSFDDASTNDQIYWVNDRSADQSLKVRNATDAQDILVAYDNGTFEIPNGDLTDGTNIIYDQSASEIPDSAIGSIDNSTLTNNSITVTAGTDLTTGGSASLGGSVTVDHADTSSQGNVTTGGETVIDDIEVDGRGHVTNLNTENRDASDWSGDNGTSGQVLKTDGSTSSWGDISGGAFSDGDSDNIAELDTGSFNGAELGDDIELYFGEDNNDFSISYDSSADELLIRDELNGVDLIRQPKVGSTKFIQGADIGSIEAPEDSLSQIVNAPVTSASASGDTVGYTFAVDNQFIAKIRADSDGSGGTTNKRLDVDGDIFTSGTLTESQSL